MSFLVKIQFLQLLFIEADGGFPVAKKLRLPSEDSNGKSKTVYVETYV